MNIGLTLRRTVINGIILSATVLTGCHTNFSPEEDEDAYYTIILYGSGSGVADKEIIDHFEEIFRHGSGRRVKVAAQVNFSKDIQKAQGTLSGTHRVVFGQPMTIESQEPASEDREEVAKYIANVWEEAVTKEGFSLHEKVDGSNPVPLYESENITEFLDWVMDKCPSEKYVIITWNYDNGWNARDERTKGLSYDDNFTDGEGNPQCISLFELYYGVLNSYIYGDISTIIADSRYTNSLENLTVLSGICDYAVVSCGKIPNCGGWYDSILNLYATIVPNEDKILETGLRHYCENTVYRYQNESLSNGYDDVTLWKLKDMHHILLTMRAFVDLICTDYSTNADAYDKIISQLQIFDERTDSNGNLICPLASLDDFLARITEGEFNSKVKDMAGEMIDLIRDNCSTITGNSVPSSSMLSTSITFLSSGQYNELEMKYGNAISNSALSRSTGWCKFLSVAGAHPTAKNPHFEY